MSALTAGRSAGSNPRQTAKRGPVTLAPLADAAWLAILRLFTSVEFAVLPIIVLAPLAAAPGPGRPPGRPPRPDDPGHPSPAPFRRSRGGCGRRAVSVRRSASLGEARDAADPPGTHPVPHRGRRHI